MNMKFTAPIRLLQDAVNRVSQAIPSKAIDPRFENIHLAIEPGKLTLFASDGEMSITAKSEISSEDTGNISIKARTLQDFLRSMYDTEVTFSIERQEISDHGTVSISTDKGKYKIPCFFESKMEIYEKNYVINLDLPSVDLQYLIQKTIFACSVDGMRPAMMGVLFELESSSITAVSTDGHRLVRCRKSTVIEVEDKQKIVVSARVLSILQKLPLHETVIIQIDQDKRFVRFTQNNVVIDASLIVEPYPNYEAVIPVIHDKQVSCDRSNIYDSVKRVGRFSSVGDIKMVLADSIIKVMAENTNEGESAQEELPCSYTGEDITIGFNAKFIEAALAHIDEKEIIIELKSPTTAVIFKPVQEKETGSLIILVMPVRINA